MIPIDLTITVEEAASWATNASKSMQATDIASDSSNTPCAAAATATLGDVGDEHQRASQEQTGLGELNSGYRSLEVCMPRADRSPQLVPYGADEIAYLVVDSFGASGTVYRETEVERADLETIIADFLTGQFNDPVRVIAFNTLEHWSDDVSAAIAAEIQTRCDIEGASVPEHISDFVDRHGGPVRTDAEAGLRLGIPRGNAAGRRYRSGLPKTR
jgi:hypothetical protein